MNYPTFGYATLTSILAQLNLKLVFQFSKTTDNGKWMYFCKLKTLRFRQILGCNIVSGEKTVINTENCRITGNSPDHVYENVIQEINFQEVFFKIYEQGDHPFSKYDYKKYVGVWKFNSQNKKFEKSTSTY